MVQYEASLPASGRFIDYTYRGICYKVHIFTLKRVCIFYFMNPVSKICNRIEIYAEASIPPDLRQCYEDFYKTLLSKL